MDMEILQKFVFIYGMMFGALNVVGFIMIGVRLFLTQMEMHRHNKEVNFKTVLISILFAIFVGLFWFPIILFKIYLESGEQKKGKDKERNV